MANETGCHICGTCWWVDCKNDADFEHDVTLRRQSSLLYEGKVELCGGHSREVARRLALNLYPHMDLNWGAIEQAVLRQEMLA